MALTVLWLFWAIIWGSIHWRIRKNGRYRHLKKRIYRHKNYKLVSAGVFLLQNGVCLASFWSSSPWLLPFHHLYALKILGFAILFSALAFYTWALWHLKDNYSPCFDGHTPHNLVTSGPYRLVRHPMYLAKLMVGMGSLLVSGSCWFFAFFPWLIKGVKRAIEVEEKTILMREDWGYFQYKKRVKCLLPFIY